MHSAKVVISAIFIKKKSAVCMKKGRKSRVNNSQRMLQALDEQFSKAGQYFHKASKQIQVKFFTN